MRRLLIAGTLLLALVAVPPSPAGPRQDPGGGDPSDVLDALLGGFLGFADLTGPELQKEVAAAGGIPFKSEVALDFMSRADLGRYLRELFDAEYPPEKARADERLLTALGLLEPGVDLRSLRARVMEENIAGFYDERPGRRRLYAVSRDRRLSPANQLVLAHELRHALQDQYVDLQAAMPGEVSDFDDRRLAWVSLLEGDATLVMGRFLARRLPGAAGASALLGESMPTPDVPGAPPVVRDQLVRPYFVGLAFANALVERGGWPAVQAAWTRPPESTEQVLHLEKYLARESPRSLPRPEGPSGARLIADGVLGELLIQTLLEGAVSPAQGWGGDRYGVWDVAGRTLLLWRTAWDSDDDRLEFLTAVEKRLGGGRPAGDRAGFRTFTGPGGWVRGVADVRGTVTLVATDDPRLADEAMRGSW